MGRKKENITLCENGLKVFLARNPYRKILGSKEYELTNHLGNVNVVITDKRKAIDATSDNITDYYMADVRSANDYYPFGMQMPGRSFNSPMYRFGFNGKENDNEVHGVTGSFQDYGFRMYDPRLGRFISVDPLSHKYPHYSPYQFAGNNPIWATDLDGLEEDKVNQKPQSTEPKINNLNAWKIIEQERLTNFVVNEIIQNIGEIELPGALNYTDNEQAMKIVFDQVKKNIKVDVSFETEKNINGPYSSQDNSYKVTSKINSVKFIENNDNEKDVDSYKNVKKAAKKIAIEAVKFALKRYPSPVGYVFDMNNKAGEGSDLSGYKKGEEDMIREATTKAVKDISSNNENKDKSSNLTINNKD